MISQVAAVMGPHRPGHDTHGARSGNAPIGSLGQAGREPVTGRQISGKARRQPNCEPDPDRLATLSHTADRHPPQPILIECRIQPYLIEAAPLAPQISPTHS